MPRRQGQDYETLKHFWRWAKGFADVKAEDVSRVDPDFGVTHTGVRIMFPLSETLSREVLEAKVFSCREITEGDLHPGGAQVWVCIYLSFQLSPQPSQDPKNIFHNETNY